MTIVLKHLAKEFSANPRRIRMILRQNNLKPTNGRWTWPDDDDPQLTVIRTLLGSVLSSSPAMSTQPPTQRPRKQ